jgi:hypothetical protein
MKLVAQLEALLAALTPGQLSRLRPADLQRLSNALYANHALVEMELGRRPFPRLPPQRRAEPPRSGVLGDLHSGNRAD